MKSVAITFVLDSQSVQTGNEFYPSGSTAHFFAPQADALVKAGRAVYVELPPVDRLPTPAPPPLPNYADMTVKELRVLAKDAGLPGVAKMRKAELVAALEDK